MSFRASWDTPFMPFIKKSIGHVIEVPTVQMYRVAPR
jgi:hypothetical protein